MLENVPGVQMKHSKTVEYRKMICACTSIFFATWKHNYFSELESFQLNLDGKPCIKKIPLHLNWIVCRNLASRISPLFAYKWMIFTRDLIYYRFEEQPLTEFQLKSFSISFNCFYGFSFISLACALTI